MLEALWVSVQMGLCIIAFAFTIIIGIYLIIGVGTLLGSLVVKIAYWFGYEPPKSPIELRIEKSLFDLYFFSHKLQMLRLQMLIDEVEKEESKEAV